MNFKLVYTPEIFVSAVERYAEGVEEEWFREPTIYKEVEWVEFPDSYEVTGTADLSPVLRQQNIAALRAHLETIAKFPLEETSTGLRVRAYVEK